MFQKFPGLKFVELTDPATPVLWSAGGKATWKLGTLPLQSGKLIDTLAGFLVTIRMPMNFGGGTAAVDRPPHHITTALIADVNLDSAWHGTPVSKDDFQGKFLDVIERISCGHRYFTRRRIPLRGADAAAGVIVTHSVFIPVSFGCGASPQHSCLPTLFYRPSTLTINWAAQDTVRFGATGLRCANTANSSVRVSAVIVPQKEIVFSPAHQWRLFTSNPTAASNQVFLNGFGSGNVQGVQADAAIDTCLIMSQILGSSMSSTGSIITGSHNADSITELSCDWLNQPPTKDVRPFWAQMEALDHREHSQSVRGTASGQPLVGYVADQTGFGFEMNAISGGSVDGSEQDIANWAWFTPLRIAGRNMETSKLPRVLGSQTYNRAATILANTADNTLAHHWKPWTDDALADARRQLVDAGLVAAVCGTNDVDWEPLPEKKNAIIDPAVMRYLPRRLAPKDPGVTSGR